jgi:hypothetical protein
VPEFGREKVDYVSDIVELFGDSDEEEWMYIYLTLCGRLHQTTKLQNVSQLNFYHH